MIILGIDPGLATMGFGVVKKDERGGFSALDYGVVTTPKEETLPVRLSILERGVNAVLEKYRPDEIAFEELFFTKNITTGIAVAQARGVTLLTCVKKCPALYEYTPMQIKQALTGYGKAEKKQMQMMVKAILGLDEVPKPDDTADALAAAICHGHSAQAAARIRQYGQGSVKNLAKIREAQKTKNRWEQLIEEYEKGEKK